MLPWNLRFCSHDSLWSNCFRPSNTRDTPDSAAVAFHTQSRSNVTSSNYIYRSDLVSAHFEYSNSNFQPYTFECLILNFKLKTFIAGSRIVINIEYDLVNLRVVGSIYLTSRSFAVMQ